MTGDARDEVVLWDEQSVWIYTQDGPPPKGRLYAPLRNPTYNDSNYRANISLPGWKSPAGDKPPAAASIIAAVGFPRSRGPDWSLTLPRRPTFAG